MTNAQPPKTPPATRPRRAWVVPRVDRMKAGDAENGIDPIIPDGAFTFGS
ncbi:MAG: hypothetical protein JWN66_3332 [Sphingomonas bacterium]|jgi:hypothetical protein|nr:hypothetical protein [Sphingomonas bacterium]MDB5706216.1 hypothetical protein [Sphingomonas bacterium]